MPVSGFDMAPWWLLFLQMSLNAAVVVVFVLNRRRFREFWKAAVVLAAIGFVLYAPCQVLIVYQMDMAKMLASFRMPGMPPPAFTADDIASIRLMFSVIVVLASIAYCAIVMLACVAAAGEWDRLRPRPFPVLMRTGGKSWPKNLAAAGIAVAGAIVSYVLVRVLHVGASDVMKELFPDSGPAVVPPAAEFAITLAFVTGAALAEEIMFRGALLGFLFRLSRSRVPAMLASIFSTSLAWALLHYPNTDSPAFKIAQVFVLGVILAEVTRRWSLESSVVLHATFNAASLVIAYLPLG